MAPGETIVALSSGSLPSGVAVIRLSGPQCRDALVAITGRHALPHRRLVLTDLRVEDRLVDRGLAVFMPGPASFTGEDCLELHCHGSAAVVRALLSGLTRLQGVRLAEAGEFTRRAFENGRLDLLEAQGIADLVAAETENQRQLAIVRMEGGLSRRIEDWRNRLLDLRSEIEAQIDFSDEGDVGELPANFDGALETLRGEMVALASTEQAARIVRSGYRVVLAGAPNAGKSSLLNALSRSDAAIVSAEPGTTRDLKEVPLDVRGQLIILVDSAGLRETTSEAESIGVSRAHAAMKSADLVLWLDADDPPAGAPLTDDLPPVISIASKADLRAVPVRDVLNVSVVTAEGLAELLEELYVRSGAPSHSTEALLIGHERDRLALAAATDLLAQAQQPHRPVELIAEDLRAATVALERLIGRVDAEMVLDRLFTSFCIGK